MPRYRIRFRVDQVLAGSIVVIANNETEARKDFNLGVYDDDRLEAKLDLDQSHDTITEILEE